LQDFDFFDLLHLEFLSFLKNLFQVDFFFLELFNIVVVDEDGPQNESVETGEEERTAPLVSLLLALQQFLDLFFLVVAKSGVWIVDLLVERFV